MGVLNRDQLLAMGFRSVGEDVRISDKASIYGAGEISIGSHVRIDDFCVLSGRIELGSYIHIAVYSALFGGQAGIRVDDFANISSRVCVYALSDDYSGMTMTNPMVPDKYKHVDHGPVHIGRHCIIGTGSSVMPHVKIGEGCAFGAYSFINRSCEPWGMYVGIPCKRIRERKRELIRLQDEMLKECEHEQN